MKRRISVSLKITLIVVSLSALIIMVLTYLNIQEQAGFFESNYSERGVALTKALDASIQFYGDINDIVHLQNYIVNVSQSNPELLKININRPGTEGLQVVVSSDTSEIGMVSNQYHMFSYEHGDIYYIPFHNETSHLITVIAPMNISGHIVGTYEIIFSMNRAYAVFDVQMRMLVAFSIISLFFLIFGFLFLLRQVLVKPIIMFRDATKVIGEGNLDKEVAISSKDELGDLADAFNKMAHDLKISREKIEEYNKTLENLLDQKDEFIGQLGHDLKNPLTPLVGLLPMIMEQEKDPQLKEHLRIIVHNVDYMQDLVLKTLQLARLRSPATKFDFQPLSLLDELKKILETQQLFLQENHMTVINNINASIIVEADRLRLVELFNNLLTNATKYTPKGGGTITIDAVPKNDFVTISIKDAGIGMNSEQLSRIFDEFYKADLSRHEMDSSGLGLSICKRIVERHGGRIWAESPGLGKGSVFSFTLKTGKLLNSTGNTTVEG